MELKIYKRINIGDMKYDYKSTDAFVDEQARLLIYLIYGCIPAPIANKFFSYFGIDYYKLIAPRLTEMDTDGFFNGIK